MNVKYAMAGASRDAIGTDAHLALIHDKHMIEMKNRIAAEHIPNSLHGDLEEGTRQKADEEFNAHLATIGWATAHHDDERYWFQLASPGELIWEEPDEIVRFLKEEYARDESFHVLDAVASGMEINATVNHNQENTLAIHEQSVNEALHPHGWATAHHGDEQFWFQLSDPGALVWEEPAEVIAIMKNTAMSWYLDAVNTPAETGPSNEKGRDKRKRIKVEKKKKESEAAVALRREREEEQRGEEENSYFVWNEKNKRTLVAVFVYVPSGVAGISLFFGLLLAMIEGWSWIDGFFCKLIMTLLRLPVDVVHQLQRALLSVVCCCRRRREHLEPRYPHHQREPNEFLRQDRGSLHRCMEVSERVPPPLTLRH